MQTFVPYGADFRATAEALDYRRLGKQRVETWQILNTLTGASSGWRNHPAVKMWDGHAEALAYYGATMCIEWARRGYTDNMLARFLPLMQPACLLPSWIDREDVMLSHRSNLIRKDAAYYGPMWPSLSADMPYVWPV